jgi:hypothetical protein
MELENMDRMSKMSKMDMSKENKPKHEDSVNGLSIVPSEEGYLSHSTHTPHEHEEEIHPEEEDIKIVEKYLKIDDFLEYIILTQDAFLSD